MKSQILGLWVFYWRFMLWVLPDSPDKVLGLKSNLRQVHGVLGPQFQRYCPRYQFFDPTFNKVSGSRFPIPSLGSHFLSLSPTTVMCSGSKVLESHQKFQVLCQSFLICLMRVISRIFWNHLFDNQICARGNALNMSLRAVFKTV